MSVNQVNSPEQTRRDYGAQDAAQAIDRVLQAEQAAQSAIADCEKQGRESLELARQQRRTILERAQQRIVALHTRAARGLEQRLAQIRELQARRVAGTVAQTTDGARMQAATEKLVDRLLSVDEEI
jgi:vacuolar-type H+-ATPase subunit H